MAFHRFHSLRARLILAFLVTVLLPLIGTGLYGNWTTSRTLEAQALDNARADLRLRARQIETYLGGVREDLLFLSQLDSLAALLASPEQSQRATASPPQSLISNLQSDFSVFAATHPDVFQTRYLDATGMEVIRVDSTSSGLVIIPAHHLQNKADRYYFSATMQLAAGQVYISPADLNRDFGVIQVPHVPTIRYATPVFHPNGSRAGIVILNLYAEPFLRFARADAESDALLALADHSGLYLAHPDAAREWGGPNDLDTGAGAAVDYPLRWPVIAGGVSGVYAPPPGNWWAAFAEEVLPVGLFNSADSDSRRVLVYETVWANTGSGPHWHLLRDEPRVHFFAAVSLFRLTAITILTAAALIALVMAVGLARSLTAPILALTEDVRRFGQDRLGRRPTQNTQAPPGARDEIGELTAAFAEMSAAINHHLEQLSLLNRAGHHITARLERPAVLKASAYAAARLLAAEYIVIRVDPGNDAAVTYAEGDKRWAAHRSDPALSALMTAAIADGEWRTAALPGGALIPSGYLCAAPLCVSGRLGLVELYGPNPALADPVSGNLLATLAMQISIALENAELYEQLAERRAELQTLVEQLINAQEEERRLVAYDIHDGLIQLLVGARLQLNNAIADHERERGRAETALRKGFDELAAAIAEARRVIEGLRPAALDDLGLVTTLRQFAEDNQADCDWELDFTASPPDLRLPPPVETTAFRIAQEAITNARKYAETKRLQVALILDDDAFKIEVRDWGRGFDFSVISEGRPFGGTQGMAQGRGVGLIGMRERARLLGGECIIESAPGVGTTVHATLPLPTTDH